MADHELRNVFREKFEGFEPEPSRELWQGIESAIQSKDGDSEKSRKRVLLWPYGLAAAAVVAVLIALGIGLRTAPVEESFAEVPEQVLPEAPAKTESSQPAAVTPVAKEEPAATLAPEPKPQPVTLAVTAPKIEPEKDQPAPTQPIEQAIAHTRPSLELVQVAPRNEPNLLLTDMGPVPAPDMILMPDHLPGIPGTRKDIDLLQLDGAATLVAMASTRLDKMGVSTPLSVKDEYKEDGRHRTVSLGFKFFNITRKRHKQIIKKNPET